MKHEIVLEESFTFNATYLTPEGESMLKGFAVNKPADVPPLGVCVKMLDQVKGATYLVTLTMASARNGDPPKHFDRERLKRILCDDFADQNLSLHDYVRKESIVGEYSHESFLLVLAGRLDFCFPKIAASLNLRVDRDFSLSTAVNN